MRTMHEHYQACVGKRYRNPEGRVYLCDAYDPRIGLWMTSEDDPTDRRNVSERVIGTNFREVRS